MSKKSISQDYANSVMYDLQKAFWDERGRGARFRTTIVGREFFKDRLLPQIQSPELGHIVQVVVDALQSEGIASKVSYDKEDRLLRVTVEGCVHREIEEKMVSLDIEPFTCVPANLIVLAIEEKLDRPAELAEIKLDEGSCHLLLVMFDQHPILD
jgi:hypothetical protein